MCIYVCNLCLVFIYFGLIIVLLQLKRININIKNIFVNCNKKILVEKLENV